MKKFTHILFIGALSAQFASGQSATNLLSNGSFEKHDSPNPLVNGNNLDVTPTDWTSDSRPNLVFAFAGYADGPTQADDGQLYYDAVDSQGEIWQEFVLTQDSVLTFGGAVSNRKGAGNGVTTFSIQASGGGANLFDVDASHDPVDDILNWSSFSETTTTLQAGTYRFNALLGNAANIDSVFVTTQSVPEPSTSLLGLIAVAGFCGVRRRR